MGEENEAASFAYAMESSKFNGLFFTSTPMKRCSGHQKAEHEKRSSIVYRLTKISKGCCRYAMLQQLQSEKAEK